MKFKKHGSTGKKSKIVVTSKLIPKSVQKLFTKVGYNSKLHNQNTPLHKIPKQLNPSKLFDDFGYNFIFGEAARRNKPVLSANGHFIYYSGPMNLAARIADFFYVLEHSNLKIGKIIKLYVSEINIETEGWWVRIFFEKGTPRVYKEAMWKLLETYGFVYSDKPTYGWNYFSTHNYLGYGPQSRRNTIADYNNPRTTSRPNIAVVSSLGKR